MHRDESFFALVVATLSSRPELKEMLIVALMVITILPIHHYVASYLVGRLGTSSAWWLIMVLPYLVIDLAIFAGALLRLKRERGS